MSESTKKLDLTLIKHLWQLILPYKGQLFLSIVILLFGKGLLVLIPLGIKYGIDIIKGDQLNISIIGYQLIDLARVTLSDIGLFLSGALALHFGASFLQIWLTNRFGQLIMRDLRSQLFSHVISQSLSFFDRNRVGQLLTRIIHDVQTLNELFVTGISTIFGDLFLIVSILVFSFWLDVNLALVSFLTVPFLYWAMIIFKKYARRSFSEIRRKLAKINSFLQTTISGIKIIQIFNKQNKMTRIFRRIQKEYFKEYLRIIKIYSLYFPGVELLSTLSRVLLIIFGGYWVYTGESSLSIVVAFLFYSPMFFRPLRELSEQYNVLQAAMASSERIFALLETNQLIEEKENPVLNHNFKGEIEFKNVSFAYQEGNEVLHNVSFKIEAGEKVALVGVTGSGKSTIIGLINRLYDIENGEIFIDGINIKDFRKNDLRRMISSVLQEVFIFSDTIKENIRLFDSTIQDDKVQEAAQQVEVHPIIENLKDIYDTQLGERGVGLSFGEKQLLAFARAFVHKSKIVIFDEATSNIDLQTEALIQRNIKELIKDHTAIIIAHRLSTIQEVGKIIVLHKGEVKEIGTHNELLEKKGYYEKLYKLQFESEFIPS